VSDPVSVLAIARLTSAELRTVKLAEPIVFMILLVPSLREELLFPLPVQ
jgi:hypothetical protein